ncbi:MAG: CDP-glycerol glycerophosphotransferase family protein [Lachnospiraceae bacterium]|nr:CDP-glycerol glycerophosphotransferase family protein [Lachnospiraceae bacterium]
MNDYGILLYIDPGTGSMLFSVIVGVAAAVLFFLQKIWLKVKFMISGGKVDKTDTHKIPYLIFSDNKWYWNIFKPVCDEFERRKIPLEYWTAAANDPALNEKYEYVKCEFIGEGNKAFAKLNFAKAGILLSTTPGLDVYQWKRSQNVDWYVHTFHSTGDSALYRMFGLDFYDAVLLSGSIQEKNIRNMEKLRPTIKRKELTYVGSAYMDVMKIRLNDAKSKKDGIRTVLVASSWGKSSVLSRFGGKLIEALQKTGYNIIVRPHPQSFVSEIPLMESLQKQYPESEKLHWNRDNDNFDVLNEADIMITDFSSVIFDYALVFDKPVLYADTSFDLSPYDAWWLEREGLYRFDAHKRIGQLFNENDFENIKELIDRLIVEDPLRSGRNELRSERWEYAGEAAVRTVDYLVGKHEELEHTRKKTEEVVGE